MKFRAVERVFCSFRVRLQACWLRTHSPLEALGFITRPLPASHDQLRRDECGSSYPSNRHRVIQRLFLLGHGQDASSASRHADARLS